MSLSEAKDQLEDASVDDVAQALKIVMAGQKRPLEADSIKTDVLLIASQGWKRAELMEAASKLANDPELRDRIRYGGTIVAADFEEIRREQVKRIKHEDGSREEVGELSRQAYQVRKARLYSYGEALELWTRMGQPGSFSDSKQKQHPGSLFTVVDVEGTTYWKLK